MLKNELQEKLAKLDSQLKCEIITKDNTKFDVNGGFAEFQRQSAGDVIVKYAGETVLSMIEVDGTPAIELKGGYVDKPSSKLLANLIELCGSYLPDDGKEF